MSDDSVISDDSNQRFKIALWLVGGAGLTILIMAITAISVATDRGVMAEKVLTMILPMLATWVGTVIAYYFSSENYRHASDSASKLFEQAIDQKLKNTLVADVMITHGTMQSITLPSSDDGHTLILKESLIKKFSDIVTRIPILDERNCFRYIIHQSLMFKFVADKAMDNKSVDMSALTLKDFLGDKKLENMVTNSVVFVNSGSTLADAKSKMEALTSCQDVFVTEDGTRNTAVKGWLTNVDIAKHAKA